jgi:hypothetical protein
MMSIGWCLMAPDHQVLDILKRSPVTEVQKSLAEAFDPVVLQSQLQQHLQNQSQPTQQQRISIHDAVHIVHRELQVPGFFCCALKVQTYIYCSHIGGTGQGTSATGYRRHCPLLFVRIIRAFFCGVYRLG